MEKKKIQEKSKSRKSITVYNLEGLKTGIFEVPEEFINLKENKHLIAQSVRVFLANQRKAYAKAKRRGEVRGSGKKIWAQKGTGRARHGDRYAPIFVSGGTTHGPTGKANYHLKISKRMKKKAIMLALSDKLDRGLIVLVEGVEKMESKSRIAASFLKRVKDDLFKEKARKIRKCFLLLPEKWKNVELAFRNIEGVKIDLAKNINTFEILNNNFLVTTKKGLEIWKEWLSSPKKKKSEDGQKEKNES